MAGKLLNKKQSGNSSTQKLMKVLSEQEHLNDYWADTLKTVQYVFRGLTWHTSLPHISYNTLPGRNSGKSSVTLGNCLVASRCMIPARGSVSLPSLDSACLASWGPISDSESELLLKSTLSEAAEEGAMMEGKMIPSPSSILSTIEQAPHKQTGLLPLP